MQPAISAAVSRERELIFIKATAEMTNNGQRSVHIDLSETRIGISTRKAGVYGWNPSVVEEVFTGNNHVSPGETIGDQVWMEIPDNDDVAIQLELRVTKRYEEECGKFLAWIARDIVNLAEDQGNISSGSTSSEESEG